MGVQSNTSLKRVEDKDGWRWYEEDGVSYISVTKVLEHIVHERLVNWFRNKSANFQKKTLEAAGSFGTGIHELIEKECSGVPFELKEEQKQVYANWIKFKIHNKLKLLKSEQFVCSKKYGYAGTLDLIVEYKGKLCVGDIKTGRYNIKTGWQIAAYRQAYLETHPEIKELGMVGLSLPRDGSEPKLFEYTHIDECFIAFLSALNSFKMLYFNKLKAINWPFLEHKILEVVEMKITLAHDLTRVIELLERANRVLSSETLETLKEVRRDMMKQFGV